MTVSALTTRNDITATSGQATFTYTFMVLAATDMTVYQNGALLASGYTVTGVGSTTGGTVVLDVGALTGQIVSLVLAMPLDRTTDYQNSGDFLASDVNNDFDKIYIGAIQNENWIDRSIRLQQVEPAGFDMELPVAATRASKLLAFDSTGALVVQPYVGGETQILSRDVFVGDGVTTTFTLANSASAPSMLNVVIDGLMQDVSSYSVANGTSLIFSQAPPLNSDIEVRSFVQVEIVSTDLSTSEFAGNGSTTSFSLGSSAVKQNTFVYINGVYQFKSTYSISGTTITFSEAPPINSAIEVVIAGFTTSVIGVPSADSVGTAQLQDNAVTQPKIADDAVGADQLASNAVVTASIADNAVTTAKIADSNVTTVKIASGAVTAAKIASVPITVGITSVVTATSLTATVNTHVYVSAATQTITLPASPAIGQRVLITVGNFTDTVVARNGSNIMSLAADFTMDAAYLSINFIYTDATQGWVMS